MQVPRDRVEHRRVECLVLPRSITFERRDERRHQRDATRASPYERYVQLSDKAADGIIDDDRESCGAVLLRHPKARASGQCELLDDLLAVGVRVDGTRDPALDEVP